MIEILIVKIGAIGDVVMALPMLSHLRNQHPLAKITWVSGRIPAPLIAATGLVDQLLEVDEKLLFQGGITGRIKALFKLWKYLFGKSFDLVITAHPDPRYRLISCFSRKKTHRFFNRRQKRPSPIPGRYHLNEYLNLVTSSKESAALPKLKLPSNPWLNNFIASLPHHPIVIIAPGGAKNPLADDALRRWPISHYANLLKRLSSHPLNLIVTGSATDQWVEPHLADIPFHNLIGKLSLLDLISLLQQSHLLITHDSGPLHLAKFSPCPKIALFGPTIPYEKVSNVENIHILWEGGNLACCPCYDGKNYARCSNNVCLQNIKPEQVELKALNLLNRYNSYREKCTI